MNEVLLEMAKQVPVGLAIIFIVYLFQNNENKREQQRIDNAKTMEQERKAHELQLNNMWATAFKNLIDEIKSGQKAIADALATHDSAERERYERMGITKDLVDVAKANLTKGRNR